VVTPSKLHGFRSTWFAVPNAVAREFTGLIVLEGGDLVEGIEEVFVNSKHLP